MHYTLRIFCQAQNAVEVTPTGDPHIAAFVTNLEKAGKLFHIPRALLQLPDGRCSRHKRYNEYARGELVDSIDWLVMFAGEADRKHGKIQMKLVDWPTRSEQASK